MRSAELRREFESATALLGADVGRVSREAVGLRAEAAAAGNMAKRVRGCLALV